MAKLMAAILVKIVAIACNDDGDGGDNGEKDGDGGWSE